MHSGIRRVLILLATCGFAMTACTTAGGIAPKPHYSEDAVVADKDVETQEEDEALVQNDDSDQDGAPSAASSSEADEDASGEEPKDEEPKDEEPEDKRPAAVIPAELDAGTVVSEEMITSAGGVDGFFWAEEISDQTFARMEGKSFGEDCTVPREDLRYVKVLHVDAEGTTKVGELVVNVAVADEVVDIFRQLYDARWPIKKMHLVDDYDGSDDLSCADGNTAAFNYRMAVNANVLSNHSYGLAIDINTFENPYYVPSSGYVYPAEAARYLDRSLQEPYMIHRGDLCYRLFTERGWSWGGDWTNINDFQHFEKP